MAIKRTSSIKSRDAVADDMLPEYGFDYRKARPNRFAERIYKRYEIGKYLAVDSRVCGGRLIFKGTRIPVADALEMAGVGYTPEGISKQYRGLVAPEAVREAKSLILRGFLKEETKKLKVAA